jgi:hypothetical protein
MLLNYQKPARLQGAVPAFALILLLSARPATSQENEVKANLRSGAAAMGKPRETDPKRGAPMYNAAYLNVQKGNVGWRVRHASTVRRFQRSRAWGVSRANAAWRITLR